MSVIRVPNNKSAELTDLETHVMLCEQRRTALEDRISKLEEKFLLLEEQERVSRRLLIGSLVTIASAILSSIAALIIKFKIL
jgi:hypothetical protein